MACATLILAQETEEAVESTEASSVESADSIAEEPTDAAADEPAEGETAEEKGEKEEPVTPPVNGDATKE